ncbi:arylamine N-acetyltransferase [Paenibacillus andongensis]|uniref:arylamine N-acetyltransferase n=1 Tax=Paenibacillus andongensis TaxID=2975482 RepID=UPI0021BB9AAE|nr:arylamine N-acetyltransferase [Paenibacillus andongensis]
MAECKDIQKIIAEHPESRFNKHRLITKMTKGGNITLTDHSFTQWDHGIMTKEDIDSVRFKLLLNPYFGM